jgi:hypothetical protein
MSEGLNVSKAVLNRRKPNGMASGILISINKEEEEECCY